MDGEKGKGLVVSEAASAVVPFKASHSVRGPRWQKTADKKTPADKGRRFSCSRSYQ
jgi:hypothetical protein